MTGYRLFKEERMVEFQKPNRGKIGLNIIVGPNNSGKSSLINLIGANYFNQINREDWSSDHPRIIVECEGKTVTIDYDKNTAGTKIRQAPEGWSPNFINMYLPSDRRWAFETSNVHIGIFTGSQNPSDNERMQHFLQVAQSVSTSYGSNQNFEETRKPNEQFISALLVISQNQELIDRYTNLVKEFIPNYTGYDLLRRRGNKYQVLYRATEHNQVIDMALVGDGVQTIMVICAFLLLIRQSLNKGPDYAHQISMLVMDEPESSLHPQAQKKLYEYIKEIAKTVQVIYATHSPYMVSWDIIPKGAKIIRIDSKNGSQADVYELSAEVCPNLNFSTQPRRKGNLDAISREILFTDKVLMVEGIEDVNILRSFIEVNKFDFAFEICGRGADGAGSILNWMRLAACLGIKPGAIYDNDQPENYQAAVNEFGNSAVQKWSTNDIRDKTGDRPKIGLFDEKGVIKDESKEEVMNVLSVINLALQS